ncbi:hypothetical protein CY35_15G085000 [Sphagnum magellanicum]|nr:hypothetical protein CY35_15G085000 [Sphagnum magellanicum]
MYTTLADLSMQESLGNASAMSKATPALWDALPQELEDKVLANLRVQEIYRTRAVCKSFRQAIHRHTFRHARRQFLMSSSICSSSSATPSHVHEGSFSPIVLFVNPLGIWEWSGYHLELQKWTKLPTLSCLPAPDRRVLKNFFVAGCDGLLCINIANPLERSVEKLIVCNPLTQSSLELPPLNYRRHPVLLHVLVDHANNSFMILVAGSSSMGSEHLCRKTEVYDSLTSSWEVVADLPGPDFGLNEYQVDKTWSSNSSYILPRLSSDATFATTQLLECNGSIYVFSEQELYGSHVHFCIAKFDGSDWTVVVNEKRKGYSRGLLVYPEYVCLAHGEGKLCIFNAVEHTMVVYDINSNTKESLAPLPVEHSAGMSKVHTLNPLPFVFRPSFDTAI